MTKIGVREKVYSAKNESLTIPVPSGADLHDGGNDYASRLGGVERPGAGIHSAG